MLDDEQVPNETIVAPHRWLMLGVSMVGQVVGTIANSAAPFLMTYLHLEQGLRLESAGLLASAPLVGTTVSLVAWGVLVDRFGERLTMTLGLAVVTVASFAAAVTSGLVALGVCLFVVGVGAASTNSASGRIVVGWFPANRRGTAMGIRQTGLPLGVGAAALLVPQVVNHHGIATTMAVIGALCAASTAISWLLLVDPPRPDRAAAIDDGTLTNPYRGDRTLVRIHASSMLLVVPQFTVWTFMYLWLVDTKDWSAWAAGALVAATQLLGAASRIGVGWWSDRVGSRLRPMRQVAIAAAATMLLLGVFEPTWIAVGLIVLATAVTVADNGLAFTAVAEIGGPFWSGKAMGWQNTGQYLMSAGVPPLVGGLVAGPGYGWAFALVALFPLVAIPLVPVRRG